MSQAMHKMTEWAKLVVCARILDSWDWYAEGIIETRRPLYTICLMSPLSERIQLELPQAGVPQAGVYFNYPTIIINIVYYSCSFPSDVLQHR